MEEPSRTRTDVNQLRQPHVQAEKGNMWNTGKGKTPKILAEVSPL
jgi:hypothetical protein